jgi:hypothetical protein
MKPIALRPVAILIAALGLPMAPAMAQAAAQHWYRCNTHTHTTAGRSGDVNAPPETVAGWFKAHGYQCLVITDHEAATDVAPLNAAFGKEGDFLVLPGQEVTQQLRAPAHPGGIRHGHVNAIGTTRAIMPVGHPAIPGDVSLAETYRTNVAAIRAGGGLAQINHPNLSWSATLADLLPLDGPYLMEVWNSYYTANNLGGADGTGATAGSTEALWDGLLSQGRTVWGTASDDSHDYIHFDDRDAPTPGKGWIMVRAPALTREAIMAALRTGQFYASTGIWLSRYEVDTKGIALSLARAPEGSDKPKTPTRYLTRFIGKNGRLLAEVAGEEPRYTIKGDEGYVRASITDSDGKRAWTQPVPIGGATN